MFKINIPTFIIKYQSHISTFHTDSISKRFVH